MRNDLQQKRKSRGEIAPDDLIPYQNFDQEQLCSLLDSDDPVRRTCAATLLGSLKTAGAASALCARLQIEKKLYTKIAIAESLRRMKNHSFPLLVDLLGDIGSNQQTEIPRKGFLKKSYPLPRDMAARTLCRFGRPIVDDLFRYAASPKSLFALEQVLDAIGHIVYTSKTPIPSDRFISLYTLYPTEMIQYKIIRCLSSASDKAGGEFLLEQIQSGNIGIAYEAARSLILSGWGIRQDIRAGLHPGVKDFVFQLEEIL